MKKLVLALAATVVGISIVATQLWLELRREREQNTQLQARVTEMQTKQLATTLLPTPPPTAIPAPAPEVATAGAVGAPAAPNAPPRRDRAAVVAGIREVLSSPEVRDMARSTVRAMLPQRFPDLAKELNLTPAEAEKFFDLLAGQQLDGTGGAIAVLADGTPDRAEMQRRAQETQKANDAQIAAALGNKYSKWQDYQASLPTRRQVTQLQSTLGASGNTLSDAQSKSLITALAAEQARIDEDARRLPSAAGANPQSALEARQQRTEENNRRLLNVASTQLNSQQLDSYKKMLDQQTNVSRLLQGAAGVRNRGALPARTAP
ncbi:MAG: hypothetical protein ABIQ86_16540 [Steroidobacteraceae bacterium]